MGRRAPLQKTAMERTPAPKESDAPLAHQQAHYDPTHTSANARPSPERCKAWLLRTGELANLAGIPGVLSVSTLLLTFPWFDVFSGGREEASSYKYIFLHSSFFFL